ncbi:MAG: metallophosphoesterase, partial [Candidatus Micrarchaeota archaeon]
MEIRYFWLAFLAALIIFSYYVFFFEPGQIVVKKTKLDIGLNESIRIVFISDIHVETISDEYLGQVVVAANSQNADYIFLGGDYSDGGSQISRLAPLGDLQAKKGQFAVLGNHDYLYDETSCSKSQEETGNEISSLLESMSFSVLRNDVAELDGFTLVGIDDEWACRDDYFSAIEGVDLSGPGILLTHNQEAVPYDEYQNWNLILAGHTH